MGLRTRKPKDWKPAFRATLPGTYLLIQESDCGIERISSGFDGLIELRGDGANTGVEDNNRGGAFINQPSFYR